MNTNELDKSVRGYIYNSFAKTGLAPTTVMIADHFGIQIASAENCLERLSEEHQIALAPGSHSIWMAHPFSGLPTNYTAKIKSKEYFAN